ncbi:NfeD family protein [Desulfospira joergensenii]|uniref:NfeD family protein n=1 Tax=Desulfospira joergensenii TaxID=53329 RepID=UPI0003B3E2C0|nr:NfeD family protein [Desulfospira joergensenii]
MQKAIYIIALGIFILFWLQLCPGPVQARQSIHVVPVEGMVEPGMAAFVKRSLDQIPDDPETVILFKLNTFGGRVDSALEIVDALSGVSKGKTISYVEKKAISAGALIALAGHVLVMKEHTLIGDCAPMFQTGEGQKEAGEKTQTVLRAQFRALAKKNHYPEILAESMVSKNMEVYEVTLDGKTRFMDQTEWKDLDDESKKKAEKKTIVAKGELLTMDDTEARNLGFSRGSVPDLDQALKFLGYEDYTLIITKESWSESLVRMVQPFLSILMLVGIGALYTEIKAPGFGLPGIIGIVCLGLVFFNQYLVGLADYTELLLLLTGCLLLGIEVFVLPGFGVAGISGLMVIAAGLVLAFQDFVIPSPDMPWQSGLLLKNLGLVLGSFMGAFLISLFTVRFLLPRFSTLVKGPYLSATLEDSHADSREAQKAVPGDTGRALTPLRPSGKMKLDKNNYKIDAITRGEFILAGTRLVVEAVERNRVFVRRKDE